MGELSSTGVRYLCHPAPVKGKNWRVPGRGAGRAQAATPMSRATQTRARTQSRRTRRCRAGAARAASASARICSTKAACPRVGSSSRCVLPPPPQLPQALPPAGPPLHTAALQFRAATLSDTGGPNGLRRAPRRPALCADVPQDLVRRLPGPLAAQHRSVPGPAIPLECGEVPHRPGPEGIEVDGAGPLEEVRLRLHHAGCVPVLEAVAVPLVPAACPPGGENAGPIEAGAAGHGREGTVVGPGKRDIAAT